jgi:hypothetical protein
MIASSIEPSSAEVPIKRSSSDDFVPPDQSSLLKRVKKEMVANKENVLPSPSKTTGQITTASPLPGHSSPTRGHGPSNQEMPWSNLGLPTSAKSFGVSDNDLNLPESAGSSKLPISTELFSSKDDRFTFSGDVSQFPDLLTVSTIISPSRLRAAF